EAPYSGEAALALAELQLDDADRRAETAELARRAIRFGAGPKALEVLARVDPEAAARLAPMPGSGSARPAPGAERADAEGPADDLESGGSSRGPEPPKSEEAAAAS